MQCVILAGGLGTRMRPLTYSCPKTLLPVLGRPFAYYQLHWLAAQGITEVVYAIGHHGDMIRRYWDQARAPVQSLRYVDEGDRLRGTGGALRLACEQGVLEGRFFVIYGDSFLPIAFAPVWQAFQSSGLPALMTVLHNRGEWERSNAKYEAGRVLIYDKQGGADLEFVDYGLSAFERCLFEADSREIFDLATLLQDLSLRDSLAGFEVQERFYEIGSPEGLAGFQRYLEREESAVTS